jgi:uncharacterized repeat protein (TIGR04138 family)
MEQNEEIRIPMQFTDEFVRQVENVAWRDGRYGKKAYLFVYKALDYTLKELKAHRHVTGRELLEGISAYGLQQYGPMTKTVFHHWGIRTTEDFGNIVFNLVEAGLMGKTDEDSIDDFRDIYDFDEEFDWQRRRPSFKQGLGIYPKDPEDDIV